MRRAKIVATLGPASRETATIEALLSAGANTVRINMSHGTLEEHAETISRARAAAAGLRRPLAVLVDLSGPKIRTGVLSGGRPVQLEANQTFVITTRAVDGTSREVMTNYPGMARDVSAGARLLLDDGAIELYVERATDTDLICRVINGGTLGERKGINLPGVQLPIPSLTDKDRRDLTWAVKQSADYIALSFVRRAQDCIETKSLIKAAGGHARLVSKIEKAEAIDSLESIIEASDGVMVARGDLGVETSVEIVPVYQKRIIAEANLRGKFVITATQMLQSMIESPRPTRAEASDVANAVWDGSDALMLSAESASGAYPGRLCRDDGAHHRIRRDRTPRHGDRQPRRTRATPHGSRQPRALRSRILRRLRDERARHRRLHRIRAHGAPPLIHTPAATHHRPHLIARSLQRPRPDLGRRTHTPPRLRHDRRFSQLGRTCAYRSRHR
jgi:pyruvate kinase